MVKFLCLLLVLSLLVVSTQSQQEKDFFTFENETDQNCSPATDDPSITNVSSTENSTTVTWSPIPTDNISYEVIYRQASSTKARAIRVLASTGRWMLEDLSSFSDYRVYIRLWCSERSVGQLSSPESFRTPSSRPNEAVTNLTIALNHNQTPNLVRISWSHIPDNAWNGYYGGYVIYIFSKSDGNAPIDIPQVAYPLNEYLRVFPDGDYAVNVEAFNNQGRQSNIPATMDFSIGMHPEPSVLEYWFYYILIPGIVFLVIIIVITVVIFKKIHESRRRSVTYCKDISSHQGYPNVLPLQERRSPSSSASPGALSPSVVVTQTSFSNRPLPLSPNGPSPTRQPAQPQPQQQRQQVLLEHEPPPPSHFTNSMNSFPPAPKLPHPGPLPQLSESLEPGFPPMQRTLTNQSSGSVFSPTGVPFQHQQPRMRAQTVGEGMPSPYEIPEHNGSTLSRGDSNSVIRPASASAAQHRAIGGIPRGGNFPPPPAHSPPPLTHSSMELRARMDSGEGVITSPPGQNTLPRSVSSTHQASGGAKAGMKHIRSEGQFPIFESEEKADLGAMYIHPLDSSMETSIHSMSSYGQNGVARRPSLDVAPYPYPGGLATNGSVVDSEHFTSFAERNDRSVLPPGIPRAPPHNPTHHERDRSVRSNGRESLFSETSIELSVSSSERDLSPEWDHRGAKSDVGVGNRHEPSRSPEARDTVSEVGAGYKPHSYHVYKQV